MKTVEEIALEVRDELVEGSNFYISPADAITFATRFLAAVDAEPCPKCAEWENKYLMEVAVNAGDGVLLSENERLKEKCAELEAEDSAVQLLKDSTINQQTERIKELEVERAALREDRDEHLRVGTLALQERDALAITLQQMREAIKRQWDADDRLMNAPFNVKKEEYEAALEEHTASHDSFMKLLNEPDHAEIIKRHNSEVLSEVIERIIDNAINTLTSIDVIRLMIKELEEK